MHRFVAYAVFAILPGLAVSTPHAFAADVAVVVAPPSVRPRSVIVAEPTYRRQLTTYMAKYPFGVLREDYTPLGAPGVSKRDYYGVPRHYATLHASPRRWWRRDYRRTVVSARY